MAEQKSWELENAIKLTDPTRDALYALDQAEDKRLQDAKPWKADPSYFKYVRISAMALIKMVMHTRSGGDIEVMGLAIGYVRHETFIVTDALRLPVEGTETRVNAQDSANEYMVQYLDSAKSAGQKENVVGWYHSHPGYGCWLSGIDVSTQHSQQSFSDPFMAIVIDPHRTISAGKVDIGAFRTYPDNYKPPAGRAAVETNAAIPMTKSADFGAHADRYYSLEVSHFKSTADTKLLEALWNKYWVQTLSSSPLLTNREYITAQIQDLTSKTRQAEQSVKARTSMGPMGPRSKTKAAEGQMFKLVDVAEKVANEEKMALMAAELKERVFGNGTISHTAAAPTARTDVVDTHMAG